MPTHQLIRLSSIAAMCAGLLRALASFLSGSEPGLALEALYFVTDVCLLFGLLGLYAYQHEKSGRWGFVGFVVATIGIGLLIGPDGVLNGVPIYPVAALIFSVGLVFFAIGAWQARQLPRWQPALWVLSTLIGIVGYFIPGLDLLFVMAGLLFGVGFAGAGLILWSAANASP